MGKTKMTANELILCGLLLVPISCQDCPAGAMLPIFVNVSDNATFQIIANNSRNLDFTEILRYNGTLWKPIFYIHYLRSKYIRVRPVDTLYNDRSIYVTGNESDDLFLLRITLTDIVLSDNGTYIILPTFEEFKTCYILYVLGPPDIKISASPSVVQEGSSGHLTCLTTSSTVPSTHSLSMFYFWFIDGEQKDTGGRYRVENQTLTIYSLTRDDDSLVITCQAKEDNGLITRANINMTINWGPDPGPILQPSNTYYHLQIGESVPDIKCYADCKPKCKVFWARPENGSIVSGNGMLSVGTVTETTAGEYVCLASRQGTHLQASKSIYLLVQGTNDNASTITLGVVSGAALLVATAALIVLLRQKIGSWKKCIARKKANEVLESTTVNYEDLKGRTDMLESYDAINLDTVDRADGDFQEREQGTNLAIVYENNTLRY